MSDILKNEVLPDDQAVAAPRRELWVQPGWRIVQVKRSQAGQDTNGDGPDFTS